MNILEFSNEFDVLYNNVMSNAAPGFNEYEKSVFLTKAQNEIIKNYFNPLGNKYNQGFDDSAKRQIDFSELIKVATLGNGDITISTNHFNFDKRAKNFNLPNDLLLIINEFIEVGIANKTTTKQVIPIKYDEYSMMMSRPYREPLKYQAWRLIGKSEDSNQVNSEIISKSGDEISDYKVRYVKRPSPIILTDLSGDYETLTIDGITTESECELNPIIHREILDRAVELAKIHYEGNAEAIVASNTRSE